MNWGLSTIAIPVPDLKVWSEQHYALNLPIPQVGPHIRREVSFCNGGFIKPLVDMCLNSEAGGAYVNTDIPIGLNILK